MSQYCHVVLLVYVLILCQADWSASQGIHGIDSYTLPDGLERVNGSEGERGCGSRDLTTTPQLCIVSSDSGGTVSELTDGNFPDPEGTFGHNWAEGFFTVNRGNSSAIEIGFRLERSVVIGEVQLSLLNCPARGIGAPNIALYGSLSGFLGFSTSQATQLGSTTPPEGTSCTVQTQTVSSSLNDSFRDYFLVFNYETSPIITWLFLGEVQFFEPPLPPITDSTSIPTPPPMTVSTSIPTLTTYPSTSLVSIPTTTLTASSSSPDSLIFIPITPTVTSPRDSSDDSNDVPLFIIAAVVVVALLLLCTIVSILLLLFGLRMRRKNQYLRVEKLQNAMLEHKSLELINMSGVLENGSTTSPSEPPLYSDVQKQSKAPLGTPDPFISDYTEIDKPAEAMDEQDEERDIEGYSAIPEQTDKFDQDMYSVARDSTPPRKPREQSPAQTPGKQPEEAKETLAAEEAPVYASVEKEAAPVYASVEKEAAPSVPDKSSELVEYLETKPLIHPSGSPPPPTAEDETTPEIPEKSVELVDYLETKAHVYADLAEEYAEIEQNAPNANAIYSPPMLATGNDSAHVYEAFGAEEDLDNPDNIYTEPDILRAQTEGVYETVYSEPLKPSLFTEESKPLENVEELHPYAPIYTVPTTQPKETEKPIEISRANVQELQQLGVGMFGQVILAKTTGLSLKDLRLHPTDDDKSRFVLVAMKTLKPNAPRSMQEAFEKELNFMGRLNDPNVIRSLGVGRGDTPFILIEYMEHGDLNQFLQKFTEVIPANEACGEGQIATSTLLYMSTQIASGMKHLASLNVVHRDLATRNCLVGDNFTVKISDFGMSRSLYESHYYRIRGHAILPIRWMATECFYGKFSQKSDVWAFGVTIWEIFELAKEQPHNDMGEQEVIRNAIQTKTRKLLSKPVACPDEVYQTMLQCWAHNPNERPNFEELYTVLSSF